MEGSELPFPVLDFKASLSNLQNKAGFHFCSMSSTKIAAKYSSYTAFDALLKVSLFKRKTELVAVKEPVRGSCTETLGHDRTTVTELIKAKHYQVLFYKPYNSKNSREINSDVAVFAMKTL